MNKRADSAPRQEVKMYHPNDVVVIGVDTDDGPSHWGYDAESNRTPLLEADISFTYSHGVIQDVLGRRDGDRVVVVAGRGRTRQLREANRRRVEDGLKPWFLRVHIVKGDEKKMRILKIAENSHRRDISPLTRAEQAYELSQLMPEKEAADTLGLGLPQFKNILKLLDLAPPVREAVMKGGLKQSAAIELVGLSEAEQTARLAEVMAGTADGKRPTARDVKAKVHEAEGRTPPETPSKRISRIVGILDKLENDATKDDLWSVIKKIRQVAT